MPMNAEQANPKCPPTECETHACELHSPNGAFECVHEAWKTKGMSSLVILDDKVQKFLAGALAGSQLSGNIAYVLLLKGCSSGERLRCCAFPAHLGEEEEAIWQARTAGLQDEAKYTLIPGYDNSFHVESAGRGGSRFTLIQTTRRDEWVQQGVAGNDHEGMALLEPRAAMRRILNTFYRVKVCKSFWDAKIGEKELDQDCGPWSVTCMACTWDGRNHQQDKNIRNDKFWHEHIHKHHVAVKETGSEPLRKRRKTGSGATGAAAAGGGKADGGNSSQDPRGGLPPFGSEVRPFQRRRASAA